MSQLEKFILASVTLDPKKVDGGSPIYICDTMEELEKITANLEAILDGIAHQISDDIFIIVKH